MRASLAELQFPAESEESACTLLHRHVGRGDVVPLLIDRYSHEPPLMVSGYEVLSGDQSGGRLFQKVYRTLNGYVGSTAYLPAGRFSGGTAAARTVRLAVGLCDTVFAPPPTCRSYPFATETVSPVRAPILPFTEFRRSPA